MSHDDADIYIYETLLEIVLDILFNIMNPSGKERENVGENI